MMMTMITLYLLGSPYERLELERRLSSVTHNVVSEIGKDFACFLLLFCTAICYQRASFYEPIQRFPYFHVVNM